MKIIFVNQSGGGGTVQTDGVTITGDGSVAHPIALLDAETDGVTLQGAGISSSQLAILAVQNDGVTLQGAGTVASPLSLKAVQTAARLTGAGTVASPLDVSGWPVPGFVSGPGDGSNEALTANQLIIDAFIFPAPITFSHIALNIQTGDGTNNSDVGLYNSAGTLVAHAGAQHMGSAGRQVFAVSGGSKTIPPGLYFFAVTSAGSVLKLNSSESAMGIYYNANFGSSSGGALPATITPPSLSVANTEIQMALF
jgi:hypothetical protein